MEQEILLVNEHYCAISMSMFFVRYNLLRRLTEYQKKPISLLVSDIPSDGSSDYGRTLQ